MRQLEFTKMLSKLFLVLIGMVAYHADAQCPSVPIEEAIRNGDFELEYSSNPGDPNYFNTEYSQFDPDVDNFSGAGEFFIDTGGTPSTFNAVAFAGVYDHTFGDGSGQFLQVDGSSTPNTIVWEQEVDVYPNQEYYFSAWVTTIVDNEPAPAELEFRIDGQLLGSSFSPSATQGEWNQFFETYTTGPGQTNVKISIYNQQTASSGNDFGLDDISFINGCQNTANGPVPDLGADTSICYGGGPINISSVTDISTASNIYWREGANNDLTGEFGNTSITVSDPGTYTVCVDYNNCFRSSTVEITADINPDLGPDRNVCNELSYELDPQVSGTALSYAWQKDGSPVGSNTQQFTADEGGNYSVTVSSSHPSCADESDNVVLNAADCFTLSANASTTNTCIGSPVELTAATNGFVQRWEDQNGNQVGSTTPQTVYPASTPNTDYTVYAEFPVDTLNANHDFEDGNSGFDTPLDHSGTQSPQGNKYNVVSGDGTILGDPFETPFGDQTSGNGLFFAGHTQADQKRTVYSQDINVTVGNKYGVSFYLVNLDKSNNGPLVRFGIEVNGTVEKIVEVDDTKSWSFFQYDWEAAAAGPATVALVSLQSRSQIHVFGLDDVVISELGVEKNASINIQTQDCFEVTARDDTTACLGEKVRLSATSNGYVIGWSPSIGLNDSSASTPSAQPASTTTYTVEAVFPYDVLNDNFSFSEGTEGFSTALTESNGSPGNNEFRIVTGNEGNIYNYSLINDHTSGSGQYFLGNVKSDLNREVLSLEVNVTNGELYNFSFFGVNTHSQLGNSPPLDFILSVNGLEVKDYAFTDDPKWQRGDYTWESTTTGNVTITLISSQDPSGQDRKFALDDVKVEQLGFNKTDKVTITTQDCFEVTARDDTTACIAEEVRLSVETNGYVLGWTPTTGLSDPTAASPIAQPTATTTYTAEVGFPFNVLNENYHFSDDMNGFTSPLNAINGSPNVDEYRIITGNETNIYNFNLLNDHTSGSGKYFLGYVKTDQDRELLSLDVDVIAGESYHFSYFGVNTHSQLSNSAPFNLSLNVNGAAVKEFSFTNDPVWQRGGYTWQATATGTVTLTIVSPAEAQNQDRKFGLDDVKVEQLGFNKTDDVTVTVEDCFELTASTDSICVDGEVTITAETNGLFAGWEELNGGIASITDSTLSTTTVSPSTETQYVAYARFQLSDQLTNGSFELGNQGFDSELNYSQFSLGPGGYSITTDPSSLNNSYVQMGDHTSGTGNFMIMDPASSGEIVYETQVDVEAGQEYAFSTWVSNINATFTNPPQLRFIIDGQVLNQITFPDSTNEWFQYFETYEATTTQTITIQLRNDNPSSSGNDFGLDDLKFAPLTNIVKTDTITVLPCAPEANDLDTALCANAVSPFAYSGFDLTTLNNLVSGTTSEVEAGEWYEDSTLNTVVTSPSNVSLSDGDAYFAKTSYTNGNAGVGVAKVTFTIHDLPSVTIDPAGPLCEGGDAIVLSANVAPPSGTGSFKGVSMGTTALLSDSLFDPSDATNSPYTVRYVYADTNSCVDSADASIIVNDIPATPTFTDDSLVYCKDQTVTDDLAVASGVSGDTLTWYLNGSSTTTTPPIVTSTAGKLEVFVTDQANGCESDSARMTVTVNEQPEATITGGGTICDDGSATADLEITLDAGTGPFSVDLIRNSGTPTALTSLTSPHTEPVMDEGTYTIDNLVDDNGCSGTVSGSAAVDYFDELAANANPVCGTDAIGGVTLANDEFQIIVEITGGDASDVTGDNGVTFTDGGSGVWYSGAIDETLDIAVTAVDANGCANVDFSNINQRCSCPVTASSTLTPTIICEEGDADLEVTYGTSGSSTTYNITLTKPDNSTEVLSGESGPTSTFTVSQAGIYSVAVEGVQDNCSVNGGTETLSHHTVPTATISGTATICDDGTTTDLTIGLGDGTAPFSVDILQDGNPFQSLTNESSPATVSVSTAGAYTLDPLTLTDDNGCEGMVSGTATITTVTPPTATLTDPASGDTVQTGTDDYSLTATPAGTGYDMDWTILNGQGALSNETDGSADLTGLTDKVTNTVTQVEITVSDAGGICPSATDTGYVERVDQTQAEAGPDSTICEGTAFTREGNGIIASLETAEWNYIGGGTAPAFTTSADGKELSVAASVAPGSYQFEYTVTHQINGPTSDDFTLTVDANPTNTALTQDPITTCAADIALPGQTPSPASAVGEWTITSFAGSTSPTVAGANDPTSQITGLPNGATELEWTVTNGVCPSVTEDLTINKVGDLTSPNIALDGGVYNNADVSGGDANLCEISTYDLQGAVPATDESAAWSVVSGTSVSLNNPLTDPAQPLTINGPGTTALKYTISTSVPGCSPEDGFVSLTVYEENVAVINTIDNTICEGTDLNVTTDAILSEDHGEWTITPSADLTINNADSTDITVSNLNVSTTTTLQWVVSDAGCPDDQTSVSTFVEENKTPTLSISASLEGIPQNDGDTICDQSNIAYEVNTQNIDQTSLSWTVSGTSGQFPGSDNETISPSTTGTFIVEVTGDIPSATPSCYTDTDASDVFELEAIDGPTPTLIHPTDTVICETEPDYIIRAGTDAANTWDWYVNSTLQINKGDKDTLLALGTPGIYDVYIKEDNGKCPAVNSDTTTIRVDEQPISEIMSNNYIGFINQDLILQGRTTIYDTIVWMQPSGYDVLNRTDTLTPAVNSPEGFVEQPFTMYVLNGECIDSANTLVTIRTPVKIYNSFTPNGDGVNDTWTIEGIETYQNASVKVFNRWGNEVHQQLGGYRNAWNGTRNGNELPVGTYYYIVDLGTGQVLRGDVTIVR